MFLRVLLVVNAILTFFTLVPQFDLYFLTIEDLYITRRNLEIND
jgi:hypothetical protein